MPKRLAIATAIAAILLTTTPAVAAPWCYEDCEVTFTPGAQTSWTVPSNAPEVTVTVAGAATADDTATEDELPDAGSELGWPLSAGALVMVLFGAGLIIVSTRSRRSPKTE